MKRLSASSSVLVIQLILMTKEVYVPNTYQRSHLAEPEDINQYCQGNYFPHNDDCTIFCLGDSDMEIILYNLVGNSTYELANSVIDSIVAGKTTIPLTPSTDFNHSHIFVNGSLSDADFHRVVSEVGKLKAEGYPIDTDMPLTFDVIQDIGRDYYDKPLLPNAKFALSGKQ